MNNHSGDLTSHPDPVIAEQDSWRDFVVSVCRFVFRRKVEDSASLPESSTFPIDD